MRWFELAKRRSPLEWGDKTGGDVRIGMNYIPRNNNAMMMEKYCSGSLDARYARCRCTEYKHKWNYVDDDGEVAEDGFLLTKQGK